MNVTLLIPPAIDWSMPLIAMPLLKAYLPKEWNVKVIDINAKLFTSQFGQSTLTSLKQRFITALETTNLQCAVDSYLEIEDYITSKQIGSAVLQGRSLHVINEWFNSNMVFDYLQREHELTRTLSDLLTSNISEKHMDVFGLSISIEEQIVPSFIICSILRKEYPNAKIILGGNIVSRLYNNLLRSRLERYFDLLVVGEGESILKDAIASLIAESHDHSKIVYNNKHGKTDLFRSLKTPDYSDICWDDYISPINMLPITAQRKCKWSKCDFCAIHACWTHGSRDRRVIDVVDEIENLFCKYNVKYFRIVDEMVSADYLYALSSMLIKRNINIYYEAYVRFEERFTNISYVKTIFDGGCRQLFWGLENINDEALRFMNKGTNKPLIDKCLDISNKVGITNYCFILMGIPQISVDAEQETMEYTSNNSNIHIGVVGSFVIDRLSPIHINESMHIKYGITLFDIGDLTTEVGYLQRGVDTRQSTKQRTEEYIKKLYDRRPDYALCSLLSEEVRLILTTTFGNMFANEYISAISESRKKELVKKATAHLVEERVSRRMEDRGGAVLATV